MLYLSVGVQGRGDNKPPFFIQTLVSDQNPRREGDGGGEMEKGKRKNGNGEREGKVCIASTEEERKLCGGEGKVKSGRHWVGRGGCFSRD